MANELYNSDKVLKTSGKEISGPAKTDTQDKVPADKLPDDNDEGQGNTETDDQKEEKRLAAQATISKEEVEADNIKHAESKLTTEQKAEKEFQLKAEADKKIKDEAEKAVLKNVLEQLGVKSIEELKLKIPAKAETEEEKIEREQNLKANVTQYAVKNKMLSMEEIASYENMKKTDKRDIAYGAFSKEYKEIHKDRVDEANPDKKVPVTESEIEDAFNELFHVNSENSALKKTGEKQLENYAKSIVSDTEAKYNEAVEDYQEFEARKTFFPTWKSFMKEVVDDVPAELTFGEGDNKIVIGTEKMDKAAIEKLFSTNEAYNAFYINKGDQKVRDQFRNEFNEKLIAKNIDAILAVALNVGEGIGVKKGSAVGAKAPYDENKIPGANGGNSQKAKLTSDEARKQQAKHYANVRDN